MTKFEIKITKIEIIRTKISTKRTKIKNKKSKIENWGISLSRAEALASRLGVRRVDEHAVYLGIPTNFGRSKCDIFRCLVDRVAKKVKDWKSITLSQAAKLTLVNSVVQSIPTYLMSCFRIPGTIIE
ncbi:hypothetical protein ACS0TY_028121 [Phlomoides rotata]